MRAGVRVAGVVVFAVTVSACGTNGDNGGHRVESEDDTAPTATYESIQNLVETAQDNAHQSQTAKFTVEVEAEGMAVTATGEGRFTGDDPALSMVYEGFEEAEEIRLIDDTFYIKAPENEQLGGQPWMVLSPDGDDPVSQMLRPFLEQAIEELDVSTMLDQIKPMGTITDSEETELNGESATQYFIDYSPKKALNKQGDALGLPEGVTEEMLEGTPETLPAELWLNEDQLPMKFTLDPAPTLEDTDLPADAIEPIVAEYTDWGTEIDIEAPPEEETIPEHELGPN